MCLKKSIKDYTGEAFDENDVAGLLNDRLEKARERLEEMRETIKALCEPVPPPQDQEAHLQFFCCWSANTTTDSRLIWTD